MNVTLRQTARTELAELLADIRLMNPRAADMVEKRIAETLAILGRFPHIGPKYSRKQRYKGIRYKLVNHYPQFVVLYRTAGSDVEVLHILRGKRNIAAILEGD